MPDCPKSLLLCETCREIENGLIPHCHIQHISAIFLAIYIHSEFHMGERSVVGNYGKTDVFQPCAVFYINRYRQSLSCGFVPFDINKNKAASTFSSCCFPLYPLWFYYNLT